MSWTYDATLLSPDTDIGRRYIVRLLIGDVQEDDPQLQDQEIDYLLDRHSDSVRYATLDALRSLIARYSREADTRIGHTEVQRAQRARAYMSLLSNMESDTSSFGPVDIFFAGQSRAEKEEIASDTDAIMPGTVIGQDDWQEQ